MGYSPHYLMFRCKPRLSVDFYFPSLRSTEVPKHGASAKCVDEYVASHCSRPIEGQPSWDPGPVYGRGSKTEMVLWPEYRCHRIEAWWSLPSKCRQSSREEEDQGEMGGQVSWGNMSDHNRHPLIWSEGQAWKFKHPTSQASPPCCSRSWHSLACGHLSSVGWMYQTHPSQAYSLGE